MTANIRFPNSAASPATGPSEANQIITIATNATTFLRGGSATYTDVTAWKQNQTREAPYTGIVLEFKANGLLTLGDGSIAQELGLFGQIGLTGSDKYLLGILGIGLGNVMPQIPIISSAIGYAQVVCNIALYDRISVGGIAGDIAVPGDPAGTVTVKARPIRRRDYMG